MKRYLHIILFSLLTIYAYSVEYTTYRPVSQSAAPAGGIHTQSATMLRSYGGAQSSSPANGGVAPFASFRSTSAMRYSGTYSMSLSPIGATSPTVYNNETQTASPTMRRVDSDPGIPFPDPIGDVPVMMIILLASIYFLRKSCFIGKSRCSNRAK